MVFFITTSVCQLPILDSDVSPFPEMIHSYGRSSFMPIFFIILVGIEFTFGNFIIPYAWRNIEFLYPSDEDRETAVQNGSYIPENVVLNDIDVWEGR